MPRCACWLCQGCAPSSRRPASPNCALNWQDYCWGRNWHARYTGKPVMQNEPVEVTLKVTGFFEKLGVPYLIGGSLASILYGMVRTTQDSDIIAEMRPEHIQPFVLEMEAEFYIDQEMIASAIHRNSSFNIIHRDTMFKVDVFIPRPRPFLQSQLARARRQTFTLEHWSQVKGLVHLSRMVLDGVYA